MTDILPRLAAAERDCDSLSPEIAGVFAAARSAIERLRAVQYEHDGLERANTILATEIHCLRALVSEQQRNCSCPCGDCSTCERAKAALIGDSARSPQAPIARIIVVANDKIAAATLYAPGLPAGVHDLYCEPEANAPYMRMPEGARRSQCPACGWTFGTHAPDCEVRNV